MLIVEPAFQKGVGLGGYWWWMASKRVDCFA